MWFPFRSRSNCDFYDFHVESKILCNLSARKSLNFSNFRMFIQFFSFGDRRGKLYLGMNIFIVVSLVRLTIISYYSLSRIVVITNGALFHSLYDTELTRSLWCSFVYEAVRARIWPNFDHIYIENSFSRRRRRTSRRASRFEPSFCYATALYETRGEPFNARYVYYIYGTWNGIFIWKRKIPKIRVCLYCTRNIRVEV